MSNSKKINSLLGIIQNNNNSLKTRHAALNKLQKEVNEQASKNADQFNATLSTFEQQCEQLAEISFAFESGLDSTLSRDVDKDQVNEFMQQVQDEVRLEKKYPSIPSISDSEMEDIEKGVYALKGRKLMLQPKEEDVFAETLERSSRLLVDCINSSVNDTKKSIQQLEDVLHPQPTSSNKNFLKNIQDVPNSSTTTTPRNVTKQDGRPIASTKKMDKTSIFDAFAHHFQSFIQTVGNFLNKIGKNNISLSEATTKLIETRTELGLAEQQLKQATECLRNAMQEIQNETKALMSEKNQLNQASQMILRLNRIALQIQTGDKPQKDKKKIKSKLNSKIKEMESKRSESELNVGLITQKLDQATEKVNTATKNWKESSLMLKIVLNSVDKAINNAEKAIKREDQEKFIISQQHIKALLVDSKSKYNQAQKLLKDPIEEEPKFSFKGN